MRRGELLQAEARHDMTAAAAGLLPGVRVLRKFGNNGAVSASFEAIWPEGGSYSFLTAADTIRIAAGGDAADTAAGANAQSVFVEGLDATGAEISATIATNGALASVSTSESFFRVNRAYVLEVGTYGVNNAGPIIIETTGGPSITVAHIAEAGGMGEGQTEQAIYSVGLGETAYITHFRLSTDGNSANVVFCQRQGILTTTAPDMRAVRIMERWNGVTAIAAQFDSPIIVPALSDVFVEAQRGAGMDASLSVSFDCCLRKN